MLVSGFHALISACGADFLGTSDVMPTVSAHIDFHDNYFISAYDIDSVSAQDIDFLSACDIDLVIP